jgi:hypothetical protein
MSTHTSTKYAGKSILLSIHKLSGDKKNSHFSNTVAKKIVNKKNNILIASNSITIFGNSKLK